MDGRIEGSFPGGPTRRGSDATATRVPRLRRVRDIETSLAQSAMRRVRGRRRGRAYAGWAITLVVAFAVGIGLGLAGHRSAEDLTAEQQAARDKDRAISSEVNRVLVELWRMEDIEHARNTGQMR